MVNRHFSLLMSLLAFTAFAADPEEGSRARKLREEFQSNIENILPITVYGKVVDQYGDAVSDADVRISWDRIPLLPGDKDRHRTDRIQTDEKGFFKFTCDRPYRIFADATKEGYSQTGGSTGDLTAARTAKHAPVVILLRKKGDTTYLINGDKYDAVRVFSPQSQTNRVDILWAREGGSPGGCRFDDFIVSADFIPASNTWSVTYWTMTIDDGIMVSNECLYVAPVDGYQQKVVLHGPPWPKYVYLRSRSPQIFARLEMDHAQWNDVGKKGFRVSYQAWINPYGEQNLEYDNSLEASWRVVDELKAEAKAAIQAKKLPPKPDIPQRIKAMNEKLEREKAEKEKAAKAK